MQRRALILANDEFKDSKISTLKSPVRDARKLQALLERTEVGGYEVTFCENCTSAEVRREVEVFFNAAKPDDINLVLFTGHGIKDSHGDLHFATKDTELSTSDLKYGALSSTSLEARFVIDKMDKSFANKQILFIDS